MEPQEHTQELLQQINLLLQEGLLEEAGQLLNQLHPAEIAHMLEALPGHERLLAWEQVDPDVSGDVLTFVNDEVRSGLIKRMDQDELVAAAESLDTDDLADILPDLPESVINELLRQMDEKDRKRLESVLKYPEDTAGGLMNVDTITVRPDVSLDVVHRYLRFRGEMPEMTDSLIVVNRDDTFLGVLLLTDLLTKDVDLMVSEVLRTDVRGILATSSASDVASTFEKLDLVSAPVIDENGKVLGRITIDDVVDVIREEADHTFMRHAGLGEEDDMFAPVVRSARRRTVWLGINLVTAMLASWVIGLFEATIEKLVALAVLMPIVASMGGIAGSQTLTLMIRGIAIGQVSQANAALLLKKEVAVGALNGIIWSVVIGLYAGLLFGSVNLGLVIGFAIVVNLVVAALSGATIPLLLRRYGADPALAGSVVLTTVTDVVGFFAFLGTATLFLI